MEMVSVELVAPASAAPSKYHCTSGEGIPRLVEVSVTVCPAMTVWLVGGLTMDGAPEFEELNATKPWAPNGRSPMAMAVPKLVSTWYNLGELVRVLSQPTIYRLPSEPKAALKA